MAIGGGGGPESAGACPTGGTELGSLLGCPPPVRYSNPPPTAPAVPRNSAALRINSRRLRYARWGVISDDAGLSNDLLTGLPSGLQPSRINLGRATPSSVPVPGRNPPGPCGGSRLEPTGPVRRFQSGTNH